MMSSYYGVPSKYVEENDGNIGHDTLIAFQIHLLLHCIRKVVNILPDNHAAARRAFADREPGEVDEPQSQTYAGT